MSSELASLLLRYEEDRLDYDEVIRLFQGLIDCGLAWKLPADYAKTAWRMIQEGVCSPRWEDA